MTMAPVSAISAAWQQDRIGRLAALEPEDAAAGLLWLAMNFPAVCDAMLDKVEYDAIDDPDPRRAITTPAAPTGHQQLVGGQAALP
jgi:hypothetical protein